MVLILMELASHGTLADDVARRRAAPGSDVLISHQVLITWFEKVTPPHKTVD